MSDSSFIAFTFGGSQAASAAGAGDVVSVQNLNNVVQSRKYQMAVLGADTARSATAQVNGSMWIGGPFVPLGTMTASSTVPTGGVAYSDTVDVPAPYRYVRVDVTAIAGTGTTVQVASMGATL